MQFCQKQTKSCVQTCLSRIGFDKNQIDKALNIYEENYKIYNTAIINEIMYHLTKDRPQMSQKLRKKKSKSRMEVKQILQNMNLHSYYIDTALEQYERQTVNDAEYDIENVIDIVMELRTIDCCQNNENENKTQKQEMSGIIAPKQQQQYLQQETDEYTVKTPEGHDEQAVLSTYNTVTEATKKIKLADHNSIQIQNIEREIITTEENYCEGLNVLLNDLILPIFENKYVNSKYKSKMVSTVPLLIEFHNGFLTELNTAFNAKHHSLANTFNKYILQNESEFMNIYLTFVRDYNDMLDLLGTTLHKNKLLDQFLKKMRKEKKSLLNYLILPIQRIPRILLLLKDLKRCDPNYDYIDCALSMIQQIAETFNSEQRKIENIAQCLKIQSSLHGLKYSIVDQTNNRRFEAKFKFMDTKSHSERQFYIFNDIVIITNNKNRCKHILDIRTMDIKRDQKNICNGKVTTMIQFTLITGITKPMVFMSQSIENVNKLQHFIELNRYQILAKDVMELNGSVGSLNSQLARQLACIM